MARLFAPLQRRPRLAPLLTCLALLVASLAQAGAPGDAGAPAAAGSTDGGLEAAAAPGATDGALPAADAGGGADAGAATAAAGAGTGPLAAAIPDAGVREERKTLALLKLEANRPALEQVQGVSALLATRLSEAQDLRVVSQADVTTMLGFEKQRQLLGGDSCSEQCMVELSGAVGARYVGAGRIDQFGAEYVLTFSIFDALKGVPVVKTSAKASNDAGLPDAVDQLARSSWKALGVAPPQASPAEAAAAEGKARDERTGVELSFKAGSNFISSLRALSPSGQLEIAYRFAPEWEALLEIGIALVTTETQGGGGISVVPSVLGIRKLYFVHNPLQPYWGLGLGVQLSFGSFGIFTSTGPLPTIIGFGGLRWMFADHLGVTLELSTNLAHATLGLATGGTGSGLNLDFTLGFLYRF